MLAFAFIAFLLLLLAGFTTSLAYGLKAFAPRLPAAASAAIAFVLSFVIVTVSALAFLLWLGSQVRAINSVG
jgi:hypothetical protein